MSAGLLAYFSPSKTNNEEKMSEVDRFLLSKTNSPRVAIFPTAAGLEDTWVKWITDGERYYKALGIDAKGFPVIDRKSAEDKTIANEVENYNYFVFSGLKSRASEFIQ